MSQGSSHFSIRKLDRKTVELLKSDFDKSFYLATYPDVQQVGRDPLAHYIEYGVAESRSPSSTFSTDFYAWTYSKRIPEGMHPFVHYVLHGKLEGLPTNPEDFARSHIMLVAPYIDRAFYLGQNPDVANDQQDPVSHFIKYEALEGRDPNATFSLRWYRELYMTEDECTSNPLVHLLTIGQGLVYSAKLPVEDNELRTIENDFDAEFYRKSYLFVEDNETDPLRHFLMIGWMLGFDPNRSFSTAFYAKLYRSHMPAGINPFVHYLTKGKRQGFSGFHHLSVEQDIPEVRKLFDRNFYLSNNDYVRSLGFDPFQHYMIIGWKEGKDPNDRFSSVFYTRGYPDVAESGLHPLVHYALHGNGRETRHMRPHLPIAANIEQYSDTQIASRQQDLIFPLALETSKRVAIIVVPEHNAMSGGIFSMFSIANRLRRTKSQHGYDVVLMTNPNENNHTYCRQTNFRNQEDVFRFEQIIYFRNAEEIYLHIPEYATEGFLSRCSETALRFLISRRKVFINILNQNIELMPDADAYSDLRHVADDLTQSVAHHAYFSQHYTDKFQLPTLLLPAYTDITDYTSINASEKDDLIIYSYDDAWYKDQCLEKVRAAFPSYKMIEIRGIPFERYMDLATRCRFSISFGEGFDGYVAQPIYQGGIGFTVYREEFFPSREFLNFPNFFEGAQSLLDNIVPLMSELIKDKTRHDTLNANLVAEYNKLYSLKDYHDKISKLANRNFELFPS